jgi:ABC-type phosphate transport system substrate-binding protein
MRGRQALILISVLLSPHPMGWARAEEAPAFVIIVHSENPTIAVDRKFLSDAFLKKITRWQSGEVIRPVDQMANADVRSQFSEGVLTRTVAAVRSYWQQRIFAGRDVPPPELQSDDHVLKYVLRHKGAVGYVSAAAKIDGAKVVRIE